MTKNAHLWKSPTHWMVETAFDFENLEMLSFYSWTSLTNSQIYNCFHSPNFNSKRLKSKAQLQKAKMSVKAMYLFSEILKVLDFGLFHYPVLEVISHLGAALWKKSAKERFWGLRFNSRIYTKTHLGQKNHTLVQKPHLRNFDTMHLAH